MKNSRHVPTKAISASVLNYCNLWLSSPSWHQFNIPVQAINVLYKVDYYMQSLQIMSKTHEKHS